jgi:hypothetical protein
MAAKTDFAIRATQSLSGSQCRSQLEKLTTKKTKSQKTTGDLILLSKKETR